MGMDIENKGLRRRGLEGVILNSSAWAKTPGYRPTTNNSRRYSSLGQISRQCEAEEV
jgi:hypothetical protein